ncbi:MAG: 2-phosphosulfolactate phosphatase [Bacteroidales bacterium]|nr:2-phosphosulfolactate phosphatase [Bacteroidales bacterium]
MNIEVALTPSLYPHRTLTGNHTTVAIDLLRATTAICAAFQAGCREIVPLASLDGLASYRQAGYAIAAERGGKKIGDAEYGNSPTEYLHSNMQGIRLAYSTTNGTRSILAAADALHTYVGAFANLTALTSRLAADGLDAVLLCSGWEGNFCIEDTLVAGAIIERLGTQASPCGDAAQMAVALWQAAQPSPLAYCERCTHVHRLQAFGAEADISFAFEQDTCPLVPTLYANTLTL